MRVAFLLLPLSLVACTGDDGGKNGGSGGDDTGDDPGPTYEEGCITVDGAGGYKWINDAIAVAGDGSTIELCEATGHEEAVVINKPVVLVGPGAAAFTLTAPVNEPAIEIAAPGVQVSGLTVAGTRSGVVVADGADNALLDGIVASGLGNFGVTVGDAAGVRIVNSDLSANPYGGLEVDGGDVRVESSTFTGNTAYGVRATGGATLTVVGSTLSGTLQTDPDDIADGHGAFADGGASLVLEGNTLTDNAVAGVWTEEGNASVDGDTVAGGLFGVIVQNGIFDGASLTVENAQVIGLFVSTTQPTALAGGALRADPATSASIAYDDWGGSNGLAGAGIVLIGPEPTVSDVTVSGWNNCGVLLASDENGGTGVVERTVIENVGRYGLRNEYLTTTVTDTVVDGLRVVDSPEARVDPSAGIDVLCYYVNYFAGLYNVYGTVSWAGGGIDASEGWGASQVYGSMSFTGAAFSANACSGLVSYGGVLVAQDSVFSAHPDSTAIASNYDTSVTLRGNTFTGNRSEEGFTEIYDYWDLYGYRYQYDYAPGYARNTDVAVFGASSMAIENNAFDTGDQALSLNGGSGTVTGNTFTDYRSTAVQASQGYDSGGALLAGDFELSDNTFTRVNGRALTCYSSTLELENSTFTDTGDYSYAYTYTYEDTSGGSSNFSVSGALGGTPIYASSCTLLVDDVEIDGATETALDIVSFGDTGAAAELSGLRIRGLGSSTEDPAVAAVAVEAYAGAIDLRMNDVEISDAITTTAMSAYMSSTGTLAIEAEGLRIDDAGLVGIDLTNTRTDAALVANFVDVEVTAMQDHALQATRATLTLDTALLDGNGGSGLVVNGGEATVRSSSLTGNELYGMACEGDNANTCEDVDFSGNDAGASDGCSASCSVVAPE
jgi:hypothetical protein